MQRIQVAVDNDIEPVHQGKLFLSSGGSLWSGFLVESHRMPAAGELFRFSAYHDLIAVCLAGRGTARIRRGGVNHRFSLEPGRLSIFAKDCELESVSWAGAHEVLLVEICDSRLDPWALHEARKIGVELASQFGIEDAHIAALVRNMHMEIKAGCPTGRLYSESLSLILTAYLRGRYPSSRTSTKGRKPQLSSVQLQRVKDHIMDNLHRDLSVTELAGVIGLSPHHFSGLFKNTVGITPHRYVLGKRVEEAKRLLDCRRLSIAEIAMTLGFCSQSHFTNVFNQSTGTTPRRFKQEH